MAARSRLNPISPHETAPSREPAKKIWWPALPLLILVAHVFYLGAIDQASFTQRLLTTWRSGKPDQQGRPCVVVDDLAQQMIKDGNVVLRFSGYSNQSFADVVETSTLYFRSCYHAYPIRLYLGPEDAQQDFRPELPAFNPDAQWLSRHYVVAEVLIQKSPLGPRATVKKVE